MPKPVKIPVYKSPDYCVHNIGAAFAVDVAGIEGVRKVAVELAYHAVIFFLPEIIQGKVLSEKLPVIVIVGTTVRDSR